MRLLLIVCALALAACAETTEDTRRQLLSNSIESTVLLTNSRENGGRRTGSGVILGRGADNTVVIATAAHLLTPIMAQTVRVTVPHSGVEANAEIIAVDEDSDIAVLQATLDGLPPVILKRTAQLGDNVWVVGFPFGQRGTLVNGAVSQIALAEAGTSDTPGVVIDGAVRMVDAPVNYGTSGGGVFDARSGRLVGIVRGYRTVRMAVPGSDGASLTLPVAGETTVVPTQDILCFLASHDLVREVFDGDVGNCAGD